MLPRSLQVRASRTYLEIDYPSDLPQTLANQHCHRAESPPARRFPSLLDSGVEKADDVTGLRQSAHLASSPAGLLAADQ